MKKSQAALVVAVALWAGSALAQGVPNTVSFTANLKDASGPVTGTHNFVFTLFDAPMGGNVAWTETRNGVTVTAGMVYLDLGTVTALNATILNGAPLYLEVAIDGAAPLTPRATLESVPYAVRAGTAGRAESLGTLLPGDVQRRVSGACATGAIASIDADGGVSCATGGAGTITGIGTASASGLQGGASSGAANLSLATCPSGQILKSTGAGYSCQADNGITTVLGGGGVTGSVAGTQLTLGSDATLQKRTVAPTCSAGFMTALAADGTATCVFLSPRARASR